MVSLPPQYTGLEPKLETSQEVVPIITSRTITVVATAYTHSGHRTYTGTYPSRGQIAVDPRIIPLNSKVYVEGYGYAIATDTGGLIKNHKIDLFMETEKECWDYGIRTVKITIFEKVE